MERALQGLGVLGLAVVLWLGAVHLRDSFQISHTAATWMAFSQAVAEGSLYPPLFDGERYAGTRYMPIPLVLHAELAQWTGEYLTSGKLLAFATFLLMLFAYAVSLRGLAVGWGGCLAVCAAVSLSGPGVVAATSIRNDALPVALQLGALLCIRHRRATALAGTLCAVAFLAKVSALWAPAAVGAYLLWNDRRRLVGFVLSFVIGLGLGMGLFHWMSDGRMLENFSQLAAPSNQTLFQSLDLTTRSYRQLFSEAILTLVLLPFALFGVLGAILRRRVELNHMALLAAGVLTLGLYTDRGVWMNHLLDLAVLVPLVFIEDWGERVRKLAPAVATALLIVAVGLAFTARTLRSSLRDTVAGVASERDPFARVVGFDDRLLTEDPYADVISGRTPVVLDSFMFRKISRFWPEATDLLAERIRQREFDKIILLTPIERVAPDSEARARHFSEPVWEAILAHYRFREAVRGRWYVYEPAS